MNTKTTLLALAALLGAGTFAMAEDAPTPPAAPEKGGRGAGGGRGMREPTPEMIKKYDKDGDGKLSDDEKKAMMEDMKAKREAYEKTLIEKYDADKDGKLSPEERKTAMEAEHKRILAAYDKDGDGKLSADEAKAAIDAGEMPMAVFGRGAGGPGGQGGGGRGGRGPGGAPPTPPAPPADK